MNLHPYLTPHTKINLERLLDLMEELKLLEENTGESLSNSSFSWVRKVFSDMIKAQDIKRGKK